MLRLAIRAPRCGSQLEVLTHDARPSGVWAEFLVDAGAISAVRLAGGGAIDVRLIRDLPLVWWGKAAVAVACWLANDPDVAARVQAAEPGALAEITQADLDRARQRHIDVHDGRDAALTPADARAAASRRRLAVIAADHAVHVLCGSRDPAGALARQYGSPASSVRTWLYRARLYGLDPMVAGMPAGDTHDAGVELHQRGPAQPLSNNESEGD